MDISEIKDKETLEAWLQGRPREDAVAVAARAALRALPIYWNWSLSERAREVGLTALPVLRSALTTCVAAVSPALRLKKIAADATAYTYDAGDHADHAAHSANIAVFIAAEVADVADAVHVTTNAAYAVAYAVADATNAVARAATYSAVDAAVWRSVLADCDGLKKGEDIFTFPLWRDEDPVERVWRDVAQALALPENTPEAWQFWRDWYAAMLDPIANPPNWKLYEQVALIENDVWEEGPEAIAKRIAEIEAARHPKADPAERLAAQRLLHAALSDFSFDQAARLMRMVPFAEDVKFIRDPEKLARYLDAAEELRDDIETFSAALKAEGTAMQGAGYGCLGSKRR